jgi:hypothetical protein
VARVRRIQCLKLLRCQCQCEGDGVFLYVRAISVIPSERPVRNASSSSAAGCLPCPRPAEPWPIAGTMVPSRNVTVRVAPVEAVAASRADAPDDEVTHELNATQSPLNSRRQQSRIFALHETPFFTSPFCACACCCRVRTCTCVCGVLPQHIPVPIGCEQFVVVGRTRKEADTMTLRGYKSRKSTRPERVLLLQLPC